MKFRAAILGVLLLATVSPAAGRGEDRPGTGAEMPRLKMEELEVRGMRGAPDVLYLPVPEGIYFLSPVRYDLIREDLLQPVLPPSASEEEFPQHPAKRPQEGGSR